MTTILLYKYQSLFRLEGKAGESSIVEDNGVNYAQGKFMLQFTVDGKTSISDPALFPNGKIRVSKEGNQYTLQQTDQFYAFSFASAIKVAKNPESPHLYISKISIAMGQQLEVSLERFSVSITGDITQVDTSKNLFYYKSDETPTLLSPIVSDISGRLGHFLKLENNHACVEMGSPTSAANLESFGTLSFTIQRKTTFIFNFVSKALDLISDQRNAHHVKLNGQSNWQLDGRSLGQGSLLTFSRMTCLDGQIRSLGFQASETTISYKHSDRKVGHQGKRTKIFTGTNKMAGEEDRLIFLFPLEITGRTAKKNEITNHEKVFRFNPQFIYQGDLREDLTLANQHYGIRVRGLSNEKGSSIKLDANLALLAFDPNTDDLVLQAGKKLHTALGTADSLLVPKKNIQEGGRRTVRIPSIPSFLIASSDGQTNSFVLDSGDKEFVVLKPELEISPFAPGNFESNDKPSLDKINWKYKKSQVAFDMLEDGIKPKDDKWLTEFSINPTTSEFKLLDHEESEVKYDSYDAPKAFRTEITKTEITTEKYDEEEKEKLIYMAYASTLVLSAGYVTAGLICESFNPAEIYATCLPREEKELLNVRFDVKKIDPDTFKEWLLNRNVNELLITFYTTNADIKSRFKAFVDDNIKIKDPDGKIRTSYGFWPLFKSMGIPLVRKTKEDSGTIKVDYAYDLVAERYPGHNIPSGIAIDQNKKGSLDFDGQLGFTKQSFHALATSDRYKKLFPSYNHNLPDTTNGKIDPTSPQFMGIVFRHMPLVLSLNFNTGYFGKTLDKLIKEINDNLFLDFGWRDAKGFTWIAKVPDEITNDPNFTINILDNSIIKFDVSKIHCIGIENQLRDFTFDVNLKLLQRGTDYKFDIKGNAAMTFDQSGGIESFRITPSLDYVKPLDVRDTIPGLDFIRFRKFDTNFKQLFASVELFPSAELASALPIFDKYTPANGEPNMHHILRTAMGFDLEGKTAVLSIIMGGDTKTDVFGKWPLSIKAINIIISEANGNRLEVAGEFNFGLENFAKIGGRVVVTMKAGSGWDFDIHLDKIEGSLALSDEIRIGGMLAWGKAFPDAGYDPVNTPPREALERDNLLSQGRDREFYGVIFLKAPGIFGDSNEIFVKIASNNGVKYWVSGLRIGGDINLGFGKLRDAELVFSKNSDYKGQIANIVENVDEGLKSLRKPDSASRPEWLENWTYSDKTGFAMLASGYLVYDLITAGNNLQITTPPEEEKFTGLLYSSEGIIRIEGWVKMFKGIEDVQILFTIDLVKKRILVGFQLPTFHFPSPSAPKRWSFRPGQILLGTSFGGPAYLLASFGWPPQTGGNSFQRNWSKASQLSYFPPTWPIPNVIAGGFKFELDHRNGFVLFAIAMKAGWSYEVKFGIGKAGLTIDLGGVLMVKYVYDKALQEAFTVSRKALLPEKLRLEARAFVLASHSFLEDESFYRIRNIHNLVREDILTAEKDVLYILGEIFANVHGYAYIKIFGVTLAGLDVSVFARLRVCGDTNKGITFLGGSYGATACVKVGCATKCKSFTITVTVISGPCLNKSSNYSFLPELNLN
ncbi:hypothetical protein SAMN04488057_11284 [Cyclobacterium lianum]|uniref:Uncharacterized protein n=1 Tax=Cyclobacterium lianum TaxID=388280 RepID=A0A1M7PZG9_9BACT|nr:hypothetical protein [Cyclobacterium lianum]SHN23265.1 hypothetical protein SAMN04488057_11284 [Cyclobacterium lianum]